MSICSNPASPTPAEIATYVAGLLRLLGGKDSVTVLSDAPAGLCGSRRLHLQQLERIRASVVGASQVSGQR